MIIYKDTGERRHILFRALGAEGIKALNVVAIDYPRIVYLSSSGREIKCSWKTASYEHFEEFDDAKRACLLMIAEETERYKAWLSEAESGMKFVKSLQSWEDVLALGDII